MEKKKISAILTSGKEGDDLKKKKKIGLKKKTLYYAGIFFLAPAGTVIVPCLVTRDIYLWFSRLYKIQQRREKRTSPPAK
jgi:hypothetical protein